MTDPSHDPAVASEQGADAARGAARRWWLPRTVVIRRVHHDFPGVTTYAMQPLDADDWADYRAEAGQFNMLHLPGAGEAAISLSELPQLGDGFLWHTIRAAGNVTRGIAGLRVGDTLGVRGPFGSSWPLHACRQRDVLIVAGGIGLAPLRPAISLLLHERQRFGAMHLLYGARSPDSLLYASQFEQWEERGMAVHVTVDRSRPGWRGHVGVVPLLLERLRGFAPDNTVVFCCGPEVMMRYTIKAALGRGIPISRIWVSLERNMQCAVGLCGHCQLGPEFVCKDGPVFRYDRVARWLGIEAL